MRMLGKRAAAVGAALALATGLGVGGSAAFAAPTTLANNEHIVISLVGTGNTISGPAAFTGLVNDVGTDTSSGNVDVIRMSAGTVVVEHNSLDDGGTFTEIGKTCVFRVNDYGTFDIVAGTRAYEGLVGNGTYTAHGTVTFQPNGTGGCNFNQAPLVAEVITANGRVGYL